MLPIGRVIDTHWISPRTILPVTAPCMAAHSMIGVLNLSLVCKVHQTKTYDLAPYHPLIEAKGGGLQISPAAKATEV